MVAINSVLSRLGPLGGAPEAEAACANLPIRVLFTNLPATLCALRAAAVYASDLNAEIEVFVPYVIPYPLPLARPPVPTAWMERRFSALFSAFQIGVQICLCRDRMEGMRTVLPAKSVIVIGTSGHWAFKEKRLAKSLSRQGHHVILCNAKEHHA